MAFFIALAFVNSLSIAADQTYTSGETTLTTGANFDTLNIGGGASSTSYSVSVQVRGDDEWKAMRDRDKEDLEKKKNNIKAATYTVANGGNLSAGTINVSNGYLKVTLAVSDTAHEVMNRWTTDATFEKAAVFKVTGGSVNANLLNVTTGDYIQSGGYARFNSANGDLALQGGTLSLANLNSNATITATGGTIVADSIGLSSKTLSASNTQLNTGLNQVADFKRVIEQAQVLLMGSNDSARTVDAAAIGTHEEVNSILSQFKNNVSWSGGSFYFTGSYSQSLANSATALIKSTFGSNVNVQFQQITADPINADVTNGLTAAIANAVIAANGQTAGMIFRQYAFDARNTDLVVGRADGVTTSVGFTRLNGSHGATVTGGKTLALLGTGGSSNIASGTLTADNGTIRLGTTNTGVTVGGVVSSVNLADSGKLQNVRGTYTVNSLTGTGTVSVDSGVLNVASANFEGALNNNATVNLSKGVSIGTGTNRGTMNASDFTITKTYTNTGNAKVTGDWSFGESGHFSQTAGTLTTNQDNVFENVNFSVEDPLHTISLSSQMPQEIKETLTSLFQHYVPGNLTQEIIDHASFTGGKVVITGVNLTYTMRDEFKATFASLYKKTLPLF